MKQAAKTGGEACATPACYLRLPVNLQARVNELVLGKYVLSFNPAFLLYEMMLQNRQSRLGICTAYTHRSFKKNS
jgi:hypothetical protein